MRRSVLALFVMSQISRATPARVQRQLCGAAWYLRCRPSAVLGDALEIFAAACWRRSAFRRRARVPLRLDPATSRLSRPARKSRLGRASKVRFPAPSLCRPLAQAGHKRVLPTDRFKVTRSWLHTKANGTDDGVPAKLLCPDKGHGRDPVAVPAREDPQTPGSAGQRTLACCLRRAGVAGNLTIRLDRIQSVPRPRQPCHPRATKGAFERIYLPGKRTNS